MGQRDINSGQLLLGFYLVEAYFAREFQERDHVAKALSSYWVQLKDARDHGNGHGVMVVAEGQPPRRCRQKGRQAVVV